MDYKKAGVDIEAGYKSVEFMKKHVKRTMREEVFGISCTVLGNTYGTGIDDCLFGVLLNVLLVAMTGEQTVTFHLRKNIGSVTVITVKVIPVIIHSCVGDFNSDTLNFNGVSNFKSSNKLQIFLPQMLVCKQEGAGL